MPERKTTNRHVISVLSETKRNPAMLHAKNQFDV